MSSFPETPLRHIPLPRLVLSPDNARHTRADGTAQGELEASIAAHGLLENLVVYPLATTDGDGARYGVVAGRRRLAALEALARVGVVAHDHPVPCHVIAAFAPRHELSLAENVVRVAMHPADQVEAFARLAAAGSKAGEIAHRFGVSERLVAQRLRLAAAAPELLAAYRAGDIDLECLTAFAATPDRARQLEVWERLQGQTHVYPHAVRRLLNEDRLAATHRLVRFVGIETYEAAGGVVTPDLFADDEAGALWLEDGGLVHRLATRKLDDDADGLRREWRWAEAHLELSWRLHTDYDRLAPEPGTPTPAEAAEAARLESRLEGLYELDPDDGSPEHLDELVALERQFDDLAETIKARAPWPEKLRARAGCLVTVSDDGGFEFIPGLIRPEDAPAPRPGTESGEATPRAVSPAAEARQRAGVGIGLEDDLRSIRATLVKAHLAHDFEAAFDLLLFQLARALFSRRPTGGQALDIAITESPDRPGKRLHDDDFAAWSPGERLLDEDRDALALDWLRSEDDGAAFAALRALPRTDKQALFAAALARTLSGQLAFEPAARPELEATVARLDIDFAAHVRPTAALFWSRLRKDRILEIARAVLGPTWAAARAKDKKADLAAAMETAFAAGDRPANLDAATHAAALAWLPPGFRAFETAGTEDPEDAPTAIGGASDDTAPGLATTDTPDTPVAALEIEDIGGSADDDGGEDGEYPIGDAGDRVIPHAVGSDNTPRNRAMWPRATTSRRPTPSTTGEDPFALPAFLRRVP